MNVLVVNHLSKTYPKFQLQDVTFSIPQGHIVGLIGRNGAGKSTILKSIVNFINSQGEVTIFGLDIKKHEQEIKQKIGYVNGSFKYHHLSKIKSIINSYQTFYPNWDRNKCESYLKEFNLDTDKKVSELSDGMKVKLSLLLSLSHNAQFLILDEPTSGLDPISRDEFCDIILGLAKQNITVLFSTHITSDLTKIADDIIYIDNGKILLQSPINDLINKYCLISVNKPEAVKNLPVISIKQTKTGYQALLEKAKCPTNFHRTQPTLDDIMIHLRSDNE